MDYPYFTTTTAQPFQYLDLPPTPVHTGSSNSDHYSNSPPVRSQNQFHKVQPFSEPFLTPKQDAFEYQNFDTFNQHYDNGMQPIKPPTPVSQHKPSISNGVNPNYDMIIGGDLNDDANRRGSNSDDDDNMTPAQSRRKAQNRAAQRAFRERKERHVKDLEAKLATLEQNSANVVEENERLKLQLQKAATENEILKATSSRPRGGPEPLPNAGPMQYSPTDFYTEVLYAHDNKTPSHRIVTSDSGERLLAAGATWDYIIKHPLYIRGLVDIGDISDKLKKVAKCDGQGPVFEERAILDAIENSVASGSDELL
ncbi:related to YAP1-transcriptional activator involved in oxidative stress response [Rhynchosporium agropyri]|uniref:Related to YAP1-transcriptional activator involved in oxidative stress response n=2 Tax=Rhynchosporium TaxID=38037 RepID=A0A1E1M5G0_RHYSE|nr:related to YAP1-transcriptional activator involved in oxidative stress response [Rhynchosporium agropyri]CZT44339.1 related to YAP1-transcriptional activator involved in oxidative stress response [Rhynchosporium secalis]